MITIIAILLTIYSICKNKLITLSKHDYLLLNTTWIGSNFSTYSWLSENNTWIVGVLQSCIHLVQTMCSCQYVLIIYESSSTDIQQASITYWNTKKLNQMTSAISKVNIIVHLSLWTDCYLDGLLLVMAPSMQSECFLLLFSDTGL